MSLGSRWAEAGLKEHCNDYVDSLCERCTSIWKYLSESALKKNESVLSCVWKHVVEGGFLTLLEGFSKIFQCSTEGRALMSMDLASYSSGISRREMKDRLECGAKLPPQPPSLRGMHYVDMYIKVFYFPDDEILKWISENRDRYHLSHFLTLVSFGAHNQLPGDKLAKCLEIRDQITAIVQ